MVTQKRLKELLEYNPKSGAFIWKETFSNRAIKGTEAGSTAKSGHISIRIDKNPYYAHRLVWLYLYGEMPKKEIDHINHNPADNRLFNLREVSHRENLKNQKIRNTNKSKIMGVNFDKTTSKWIAQIRVDLKQINLGKFEDFFEACCARKSANNKYNFHVNHGGV